MANQLEQIPWGELFHQSYPVVAATDVPIILRALATHGPNHLLSFDSNRVGAYGPRTDLKVPRTVASHLTGLMSISPVTPHVVPFIVELINAEVDLPTRRTCVRWLQSFFKHCTTGQLTATYDPEPSERIAARVEKLGFPLEVLRGAELGLDHRPSPLALNAMALLGGKLAKSGNPSDLFKRLSQLWTRDLYRAIASEMEVVLRALDLGDEALSAELMALASWVPQKRAVVVPRLETVARSSSSLLSSMALLALARLGEPVGDAILVMGDVLESRGERGAPAIYLACADVFASAGRAGQQSRRTLLKVGLELGRLADPFSTTIAELVQLMSGRLVWPQR